MDPACPSDLLVPAAVLLLVLPVLPVLVPPLLVLLLVALPALAVVLASSGVPLTPPRGASVCIAARSYLVLWPRILSVRAAVPEILAESCLVVAPRPPWRLASAEVVRGLARLVVEA